MGAFPHLSRNVPFCPRLSSFVPICPRSGPQEGQRRTNGDKTGHFGTNRETAPFRIHPHLALLLLYCRLAVAAPSPLIIFCFHEQLPCRSAELNFFSVFLCQRCREIWCEILVKFSVLRFPGFGCWGAALIFCFHESCSPLAVCRSMHANLRCKSRTSCLKPLSCLRQW